jgi:tripartite-type tricarboxylate transporter receptor subunit TctC
VPLVMDQTKDKEKLQILKLILAAQEMARPFAAPPGIPAERKAALVAAFDATMKDPEFLADAAKQRLLVTPMTGTEVESFIKDLYQTPADVVAAAKEISGE